MFVALTCQVVLGDHDPTKHKPKKVPLVVMRVKHLLFKGLVVQVDLKKWIPEEYRKVEGPPSSWQKIVAHSCTATPSQDKKIEKEIFREHAKLRGMPPPKCKFRYVQVMCGTCKRRGAFLRNCP